MEGEKRADGDVTEMRLARIKVVDHVAARRLGGLGRPGCVSTQPLVLLHIQRLSVLVAWIAGHLRESRSHKQQAENGARCRARKYGRFMLSSPMLEPEDERSRRRRLAP